MPRPIPVLSPVDIKPFSFFCVFDSQYLICVDTMRPSLLVCIRYDEVGPLTKGSCTQISGFSIVVRFHPGMFDLINYLRVTI